MIRVFPITVPIMYYGTGPVDYTDTGTVNNLNMFIPAQSRR